MYISALKTAFENPTQRPLKSLGTLPLTSLDSVPSTYQCLQPLRFNRVELR